MMQKVLDGYSGVFRIGGKIINNLKYADDIVLLAMSPEKLQELVNSVERAAWDYNVAIIVQTITNAEGVNLLDIDVGTKRLEQVKFFAYLGSKVTKQPGLKRRVTLLMISVIVQCR